METTHRHGVTGLTAPPLALMVRPHSRAGSSVVEHVTFNHVVAGSIPARLTKISSLKQLKTNDIGSARDETVRLRPTFRRLRRAVIRV